MKKLLAFLACIPFSLLAQNYNVTFQVNTANITVGANGIYAGGGVLGGSNAVALSDPDADGIWEGTAVVNGANGGNFVFFNSPSHGADWGTKEVLNGLPCSDPANYDDRIMPTFSQDTTLKFCFGTCVTDGTCPSPPATNDVTFSVDMNQYAGSTANGVFVNGSFNGWCGSCNPMDDSDGDGVWTVTLPLTQDSIEYKFTIDGWSAQENFTPGATCTKTTGPYTNRFLPISGDTTLSTVCWNSCSACPAASTLFQVTFRVNTANITVGPNGIYAGGGVLGDAMAVALSDPDGDGIYEGQATVNGATGGNFVFLNSPTNGGDWNAKEDLAGLSCADAGNWNDRIMPTFSQDTTMSFCFGTCVTDGTCPTPPSDFAVTFSVNTANITVGPNGLFAGGGILGWADALELTDPDGDGVYTGDTILPGNGGSRKFAFFNSPTHPGDWNTKEDLIGLPCADPNNYNDRTLPSFTQDTTMLFCFGSCDTDGSCPAPPSTNDVTFSVDMNQYSGSTANGVYVNGNFNGWCGSCNAMDDSDGDGVWTVTLPLTQDSIEYKFTVDGWNDQENFSPGGSCTKTDGGFTNRFLTITGDVVLPSVCWNSCTACVSAPSGTNDVTFSVDMNNYPYTYTTVYVSGDFNGWSGYSNPLADADNDGVWEGTFSISADSIEFKYTIDDWDNEEALTSGGSCTKTTAGFTNRFLAIASDVVLPTTCFESCSACIPPGSYTVTFRVNTANITVGTNGIYAGGGVLGGADAVALTDIGGGIWEGSAVVNGSNGGNFVFLNSPANAWDWGTKEQLNGLPCSDPANYDDRIMPTFSQDTTLLFCFGSCETDGTCPAPPATNDVTFAVDMNQYGGSTANGVFVNGTFNGWCGNCNPMDDSDGDGVWTVTLPLTQDSIDYKFTVDGWNDQEGFNPGDPCTKTSGGFTNRFLAISGDTTLATVCWNSCSACITTPPTPTGPCANLFFSEYAEGSSYNKYFEIYNPSNAPISLSGYTVYLSGNGGSFTNTFSSNAVIDSNDVFVIAHASADSAILALADTALSGYSVANFNGDDALILVNGTDTIDVIGTPGVDPGSGWAVGSADTKDNTLVRMISVEEGSTDWATGATEWDVYSSNDWTFLGSHGSSCHGAAPPAPTSFTVTFRVNTANITVGPNGIYAGGGVIGGANALALSDPDGDGIWEGSTVLHGSNGGNFVFLNSPANGWDWGTKEQLNGLPCSDPGNYDDRILPTFTQDTTLSFCFGTCATDVICPAPPATNDVTFSVDMNQYAGSTAAGVFVNGSFNGWCGSCNPMDDSDGDGVWTVTLPLTQDSIDYKFTVDGWNAQENFSPGDPCTRTDGGYTNRFLAISGDTTLSTVCWNSCSACPAASTLFAVTFRVNTANITVGPNGIYAGGGVLGDAMALALSDPDGDGIWEGTDTVNGATGGNFVFLNSPAHGGDWGTKEDLNGLSCSDPANWNDRIMPTFSQDTTLLFCFGSCETDGTCPTPATPNNVTFAVDMNQYGGSTANGVFVNGTFNGWCGNCNPMDDSDGDGVWTVTLPLTQDSIDYKFTVDGWNDQENFSPGDPCTKTSGGFTNRFLAISGDTTLATVCWNSCSSCIPTPTGPCANLFFSEYAEGSSYNKYFEIYNPSNAPISLSGYTVYLSGNGGSFTNTFSSNAVIDSNDVFVIAHASADSAILALADTALPGNSVANFNGDDALILVNGTDTIDVIGTPGVDPGSGWAVGSADTKDNTLVRMISVEEGSTDWATGATEWDVYSSNDWTYLGSHSSSCHGAAPPAPTSFTVTFRVNTANITVGPNGIYAGGGVIGGANALALSDPDGDGIWEGSTVLHGSNGGNFVFFNSPANAWDWGSKEQLNGLPCADPANYDDRILPTFTQDTTLSFCFGTCVTDGTCPSPPATNDVTFSVDMNQYAGSTANGVFVNGSFNGWCGSCNPMDDSDGDGVWTVTLPLTQDSIDYKFTVDGWNAQENFSPGDPCTRTDGGYTNRFLAISGDTTLSTVCWNSCSACPAASTLFAVTFRVNTANITVGPNGIYAGGGVLGDAMALALSDPDGDGIWEGTDTVNGATGGNFVFLNSPAHGGDWGTKEDLNGLSCSDPANWNDRIMPTFSQDTTLLFCFGSCETDGTCPTPATPNNVTFAVDMNQYGGSTANGVFVNGTFNGWCGNCNPMDDSDGDGVWTVTLPLTQDSIDYKFTVDGWNDQENFSPGDPCTKTSGGFTNRFLAISGDTTLATVCWNSCSSCAPTLPAGVTLDANGCIECDSLNVGDFFVLNGDTMEVVDKPRLLAIVAAQGDLSKVCVSHITDMKNALRGYTTNNYDISHWDVSNVTNMNSMFFKNRQFNQDISSWNTSNVTNTIGMFTRCDSFNQDLNTWDMSQVTNMNRMFKEAPSFNGAIANWDVENVVRMAEMFSGATSFNQDLSDWCVRAFQYNPPINFALNATAFLPVHYPRWGNCPQDFDNVTSLATGAFVNANGCVDCSALNIGDYFELNGDTLLVVDRGMLDSLILLHDDLSKVCVSNITDMKDALRGLRWFNTDIAYWDVSNVTDMSNMFFKAQIFNQDIGNWDVSSVTRMSAMFQVARVFDQDISAWDVSNVQRFRSMFRNAAAFNQNIGPWDVGNVLNDAQMSSMFRGCASFNQDLSMWCVSNVSAKPTGFDANSALVSANLPAWGTCPTAATPAQYTITSAGLAYSPDTLYCNVGDVVTFDVGGNHNAVEVSEATWLSNGSTPLSGGFNIGFGAVEDFTPTSAGTHYYVCTPHASLNMKGVIIVNSSASRVQNGNPIASNDANGDSAGDEVKLQEVELFPNPTTGIVKISPVVEGTYHIYNEVGRTIGEGQIKEAYDFSEQPRGIYMLMLQTENVTQYLKVVKQ